MSASEILVKSAEASDSSERSAAFAFSKLRDVFPSIMYAASVQGPPQNPISGTLPARRFFVSRMVSSTNPSDSRGSGTRSRSTSARDRSGSGKCGPLSSSSSASPIASETTRMSLNRMAASTPRRSTGWIVTSAARSGVLQSSRNPTFDRIARYSGKYRPACRMNQTGVQSGSSRLQARRYRSARDIASSIASGPACYLLQLEDGLSFLENTYRARGLGDRDGDRPRLHCDAGGCGMARTEPEGKIDAVAIRRRASHLQVAASGKNDAVLADDEGAVEDREVLQGLADGGVEDVAVRLAHALEGVDGELLALLHHRRRVPQDEDGADRVTLESFVADRHGERDHRLDHLGAELGAEADGVDGPLLLEPATDLQADERVGHAGTAATREAKHVLAIGKNVRSHGRDERNFYLLDPRVVVGWDGHARVPLSAQRRRQLLFAHRVDELFLQGPATQHLGRERRVGHEEQVVHLRPRGEGEDGLQEFPVELRVGHALCV